MMRQASGAGFAAATPDRQEFLRDFGVLVLRKLLGTAKTVAGKRIRQGITPNAASRAER
jgi:hypothetical protein